MLDVGLRRLDIESVHARGPAPIRHSDFRWSVTAAASLARELNRCAEQKAATSSACITGTDIIWASFNGNTFTAPSSAFRKRMSANCAGRRGKGQFEHRGLLSTGRSNFGATYGSMVGMNPGRKKIVSGSHPFSRTEAFTFQTSRSDVLDTLLTR